LRSTWRNPNKTAYSKITSKLSNPKLKTLPKIINRCITKSE
jgi:hypothetical protein